MHLSSIIHQWRTTKTTIIIGLPRAVNEIDRMKNQRVDWRLFVCRTHIFFGSFFCILLTCLLVVVVVVCCATNSSVVLWRDGGGGGDGV